MKLSQSIDIHIHGVAFFKEKHLTAAEARRELENVSYDLTNFISKLKGNFFFTLIDRLSETNYYFIDNSGLYRRYYSSNHVSKSFLDIVEIEQPNWEEIRKDQVVEFLNYGFLLSSNTFFSSISKISADEIIVLFQGKTRVIHKEVSTSLEFNPLTHFKVTHFKDAKSNFIHSFLKISEAYQQKKLSVDLTGGIDSRLVATLLNSKEIPFLGEFVRMGQDDNESELVKKVASALSSEVIIHDLDTLPSIEVEQAFYYSDGLFDIARISTLLRHLKVRRNQNCDLVITGTGGELYKEFWWLQDFPFYKKKTSQISTLLQYRFQFDPLESRHLSQSYAALQGSFKKRVIEFLSQYQDQWNSKTYDKIYYEVKMKHNVGHLIWVSNHFLNSYSPLLELELVQMGYNLKRSWRRFNFFHRSVITSLNRTVSSINTTEGGMSVSSSFFPLIKDLCYYPYDKVKRFFRILKRKKIANSPSQPDQTFAHVLQEHHSILTTLGILNDDTSFSQLRSEHQSRLATLVLLKKKLS